MTGANDAGKSSALRAFEIVSETTNTYSESSLSELVNRAYADRTPHWLKKNEVGCDATIEGSTAGATLMPELSPGTRLRVTYRLAPGSCTGLLVATQKGAAAESNPNKHFGARPRLIRLPQPDLLRERISFAQPNATEALLLRLAFGEAFSDIPTRSDGARSAAIRKAEGVLNDRLAKLLGPSATLRFALGDGVQNVPFNLRDVEGEMTPLTWRGTGVQVILSHLVALLDAASGTRPTLVLFDEPELHLHADFQHALRLLMERTGDLDHVQVVYATHSPAMINNRRPERVRVLKKAISGEATYIVVEQQPFKKNWLSVREGLGLTAADSLLYGDVTVVVEGDTDYLSIPVMISKLADASTPGFDGAEEALERVHFLPGEGSSVYYYAQLAKSQGSRVVVFLDGDKPREADEIRKKLGIQVVEISSRLELEDLVARDVFFSALAKHVPPADATKVTREAFETWDSAQNSPKVFTKRVAEWLGSRSIRYPAKAAVMSTAAELASSTDLLAGIAPLHELVRAIDTTAPMPTVPAAASLVAAFTASSPLGAVERLGLEGLMRQLEIFETFKADLTKRAQNNPGTSLTHKEAIQSIANHAIPLLSRSTRTPERTLRDWIETADGQNDSLMRLKETVAKALTTSPVQPSGRFHS